MKKMISRRNFLTAAGVVAAAGVLTACGGSSSSTAASSTAAASGDTIKIGVMGPLTGNVSVYGQGKNPPVFSYYNSRLFLTRRRTERIMESSRILYETAIL